MTGRQTTPRQAPLGPDVGLSELVTRMITANRVERAKRRQPSAEHPPEPDQLHARGKPERPLT
jgi:hypothetical protein